MSEHPTREEAYYAMEIGDILFPALFGRYGYVDEGPYEWGAVRVAPGDVVFDCGANLGVFSLLAAYRGAEVFAFEPIPEARAILGQTLALNPALQERVHVVPYALGAEEGTAEFTVLADTLIGSSMVLPQTGRKVRVPVTTVDAFLEAEGLDAVNFVKADIEGAERQMLAGAADTLQRYTPKVAVCTYHLADDPVVLAGLLRKANPRYVLTERWKKIYGYVVL
ncbi:FkbM family methyltransferase [Methanocorpusculum sp. MG]|uniref:FkbM family methyltransferase n=1 Tax=Methanocorpusculum petauri TaxID=3002863 RepID=A0ABT4IFK8_9EURY|nr:FkbM family methyltransferase [Methanocorpusculum petauri]MCZ0860510.1 FkbM family methyltransferase [Methanocorpusculum petauri]